MRHRSTVLVAAMTSLVGLGCVVLPDSQLEEERPVVALDQGWSDAERQLFYHESQGTMMVPYDWFMSLEQPEIKFIGSVGMFSDPEYLSRYGLLPGRPQPSPGGARPDPGCTPSDDPQSPGYNCGLPVGIARTLITVPDTGEQEDVVGFTCAGCHASELHHGGTALRIDGATNLVDVTQFQAALGGALLLVQRWPGRFGRFSERVLAVRGIEPDDVGFDDEQAALKQDLATFMEAGFAETRTAMRKGLYADYPGGFGRTDALARIANMVFGTDMDLDDNLRVGSAPVKFPAIWDAPYFSWAQYNGSIEQSMVRNVGEALGVRARVDYRPGGKEWGNSGEREYTITSTVDVPGLFAVETLLRGTGNGYFNGLQSPVWPEEHLGAIDWERADRGARLYENRCRMCHLPPLADLVEVGTYADLDGVQRTGIVPRGSDVYETVGGRQVLVAKELSVPLSNPGSTERARYWIANNDPSMLDGMLAEPFGHTEFFLDLSIVNLGTIRTDPGQAANFAESLIDTDDILLPSFPQYNGGPNPFPLRITSPGVGLQMVTIDIMTQFFNHVDAQTPAQRAEFLRALPANLVERDERGNPVVDPDGAPRPLLGLFRADGTVNREEWNGYRVPAAVANTGYRPRPLNGIWASPPYLHNGSVPTIFEMLSPPDERSETFYVGNREYDPAHLGYRHDRLKGAFLYDTRHAGNSNFGHLFQNGPPGNGTIGPALTPEERLAIIEFLKTLCPPGRRTDRSDPNNPRLCVPLLDEG